MENIDLSKIKMIPINEVKPYEKNPRINKNAVEIVEKSIKKNGMNSIIVCNQDMIICAGHTRLEAMKRLGYSQVPVYVKEMSKPEFLAFMAADNKSAEFSKWDNDLLSELMNELYEDDPTGELLEATLFNDKEIQALIDTTELEDIEKEVQVESHTRQVSGEKKHIKLVQIYLDDIKFPKFLEMCELLQESHNTNDLSDTVYCAIEKLYNELRG